MAWPETLEILVQDQSGRPFAKAVLFLQIAGGTKNNVCLGPYVTNDDGSVILTRSDVMRDVSTVVDESPMDYSPNLDADTNDLIVEVESRDSLRGRYEAVSRYFPDSAKRIGQLLQMNRGLASIQTRKTFPIDSHHSRLRLEVQIGN